ncbi:class I SAM-dependent methyltransferase [Lysobacter sp. N42]|uniref:class I SAM-dependent methyltransferase n=1 Tax=Lysobacter sp. N42 TaxID=2545719 RepID=UPI001053D20D|nr:class I SAM-dependent methyltransferase [Lysobacter sp. N42]TCZ82601.1 hypothetical protein EYQ95_22745 [Lysobacter sp. N42]
MKPGAASATALLVATSLVRQGPTHGLPSVAVEVARRVVEAARGSWAGLARHRPGRWLLALAERVILPGLAAHHCARKAWIWTRLRRRAVADGVVVWAGVGFDGLGRALLRHVPRVTVVETDHPDTLRLRRAWLGDDGVTLQAVALPHGIDTLAAACTGRPATLVCEGVLMYLARRDVVDMLRRLVALPAPPRLIFSALDTRETGGAGLRGHGTMARRWLDRHGEPFRWRARPASVQRCLARTGYRVTAQWDGCGFGEYVIEAEHAGPPMPAAITGLPAPKPARVASVPRPQA